MRVSQLWPKHLFFYYRFYEGNSHGFITTTKTTQFICTWLIWFLLLCLISDRHLFLSSLPCFAVFIDCVLRPKKTVAPLQQRRKINLSISIIKRDRTGWPSYSQVEIPVSALPKSTNSLTTASAVVASCVSKKARDPASSVELWYVILSEFLDLIFYFNLFGLLRVLILYLVYFESSQFI